MDEIRTLPDRDLSRRREALVVAHVAAENARDVDAALATFTRPRYEMVPTGLVYDGEAAVRRMLLDQWAAYPSLRFEAEGLYHGPDGVMVATRTLGPAPGGRPVNWSSVNFFGFDGPALVLERCWFDRLDTAELLGEP